jgi:hypothetical protein
LDSRVLLASTTEKQIPIFERGFRLILFSIFLLLCAKNSPPQNTISLKLFAEPSSYKGECPAKITFKGRIIATEPCQVQYHFIRSDGASSPAKEETFEKAGWKDVSMTWTIGKDYSGWVVLKVISPQPAESEKAHFKITCEEREHPAGKAIPKPQTAIESAEKVTGKPVVPPQEEKVRPHPKAAAIPVVSYQDPNEPDVVDNKDFKEVRISCQKERDSLDVRIIFYEPYSLGQLFLYFDTDEDEAADIALRCSRTGFDVARETGPGSFSDVIYRGNPSISGTSCSLEIPWSHVLGSRNDAVFWIYSPESKDRLPDSGMIRYNRSSCELTRYRIHPKGSAIPVFDNDKDGIGDSKEEELLRRFRPYYRFSEKGGKKEHYRPTDAIFQIRWAQLKNDDWPPGIRPDTVKRCGDPGESYHINPPSRLLECLEGKLDILKNPDKTSYYLNISDSRRGGSEWEEAILNSPGLYGHVVKYENLYKIEYWQFFAYNGQDHTGDHEGDWCTVQLYFDPEENELVKTCHWAHGKGIVFDLKQTQDVVDLGDNLVEYRGPKYNRDPGSLHWDYGSAKKQPRYPFEFQNNTVRFFREGHDLHVVVYPERDAHEFWPTEKGSWPTANEHNGKGRSYLVGYVPGKMNLGEIKNPLSDEAKIILRYNGFWGCYHHRTNDPPPGPTLHCQWTFPDNEKDLEDVLKSKCEH